MAKAKRKHSPAETKGNCGFVIEAESNAVVVRIPVQFYRRNGRQMIFAKDDASGTNQQAAPEPNNALASNLAKAWMWQEQLESGEFESIEDLAKTNGVGRTYAARIMRLTSLSPQVVEAILAGGKSGEISLRRLHKGFPIFWSCQSEEFPD